MDMWKSLTTGFRLGATGSPAQQVGDEEGKHSEVDDDVRDHDEDSRIEYAEAQLLPSEGEKKHILSMFYTMRKDSFFCDVAFVCNGVLFRAHRVVVSSWSRWLRALLCESPDEEVISLDFFDATVFGAALDYMYGVPLTITVENADNVLKVVRRLEMQKLEQQCWRYLMTVINPDTNVEILHELADRYDCPPLKLAAWRILQEKMPNNGASLATARLLRKGKEGMQAKLGITGLTGPGEVWFNNSVGLGPNHAAHLDGSGGPRLNVRGAGGASDAQDYFADEEEELQRAKRLMPSVFSELREADGEHDDDEEEENYGSEDGSYRERKDKFGWDATNYKDPAELDATASAAEIVQAWAFRLKEIYDQCNPTNALDYEDPDSFMIPPNSPNVRLNTMTYQRPGANRRDTPADKRTALLGEAEPESSPASAQAPPSRSQSQGDQYFRLVPSSSSVRGGDGAGGGYGHGAGGGASVQTGPVASSDLGTQQLNRSAPRRPPPPTAANVTQAMELSQSAKASRWAPITGGSVKAIDWREEMKRFYIAIGMPEKIAGISTILSTWAGREEEMLSSLMEKYRTLIPTQLRNHLEQLIAHLETNTESSFVRGPAASGNPAVTSPSLPRSPPRKTGARGRPAPLRTEY